MRSKRAVYISIFVLLIAMIIGLFVYEYVKTKSISSDSILKGVLIGASSIIFLAKGLSRTGERIPYQKYEAAYAKELASTFTSESNKKERKALLEAIHLFNTKAYGGAISKLERLLPKCQTSGDVYGVKLFMALSYEGSKSGYKAMEIYKEMIKRGTHRATPYINLGVLYDLEGKSSEAIECFYEAIRIDPTDYHSYNNLSQIFTCNNEYKEAIECAHKALELKNNFLDALEILAICYNALDDKENAEKYFKKSLQNGSSEAKLRRVMSVYKSQPLLDEDDENDDEDEDENEDYEFNEFHDENDDSPYNEDDE